MNVRRRLIGGFVGIAAFVLILFAFVTYRAVLNLDSNEHIKMLQGLNQSAAQSFTTTTPPLSKEDIPRIFPYAKDLQTAAIIVTEQKTVISNTSISDYLGTRISDNAIVQLTELGQDHGQYQANEGSFHWVIAPIESHNAYFLLLQRDLSKISEYPKKLGGRLFITAFIIIWLAIWVALVIANRIVKRLDDQNNALIYQASHDDLTGLPNRNQLFDHLHSLIDKSPAASFSLLVIDINNFKEINDTLGHDAGDKLLKKLGQRLSRTFSAGELIARLGGDEFAIVVPGNSTTEIKVYIQKIQHNLQIPNDINGLDIITSASIGCGSYPNHTKDAQALIQRAEVAMYRAKQEHASYLIYDPGFDPHNVRRLTLMADMRSAIKNGQLSMYYQPKIDMQTDKITSVESVVRWQHPEHGLVSPDDFIDFVEQSDFITEFTLFTIDEALAQCRAWSETGLKIDVAVNLSANTLHDQQLVANIQYLLAKNNVSARRLKLEVTESAIMSDPEQALKTLHAIADMGITLSIDDFGTGHSSLVYLKRLPASELKIDKAFVMEMLNNENDRMIVDSIINLAHNLNYTVVAEGIEDAETYQHLKDNGCDTAQGYHISRPLPAAEFNAWIEKASWSVRQAI